MIKLTCERQTGENDHLYHIWTYLGYTRVWDHKTYLTIAAYMSLWTKEKKVGVWDFKGKAGDSQEHELEQICWALQKQWDTKGSLTKALNVTDHLRNPNQYTMKGHLTPTRMAIITTQKERKLRSVANDVK